MTDVSADIEATPNIVITGFMGTGKTTAGRLLAELLDREFVDTDEVLEQLHGSITDIFENEGEDAFREMERALAAELAGQDDLVIATGGRMLLDPANVAALTRTGRVFCLVASPEEIYDRLAADDERMKRPLLSVADPRQRIGELLAEREVGYLAFPQVSTAGRTSAEVADELAVLVRSNSAEAD
ncbi:MAG: shikimate kinase [Acidimicrobiales bacterium]|nr:MAG: shikimate kinase [Acidimicrobiales bacterium]